MQRIQSITKKIKINHLILQSSIHHNSLIWCQLKWFSCGALHFISFIRFTLGVFHSTCRCEDERLSLLLKFPDITAVLNLIWMLLVSAWINGPHVCKRGITNWTPCSQIKHVSRSEVWTQCVQIHPEAASHLIGLTRLADRGISQSKGFCSSACKSRWVKSMITYS